MDKVAVQQTIADLLTLLTNGVDWQSDPNLKDTPRRVADAYEEMLGGHDFQFTMFPNEDPKYDQIVLAKRIPFTSMCAHHLVPFIGHASIAVIPDKKIVGLSKLARTVEHFARGLQLQERLTQNIGDFIAANLKPIGCAVIIEAEHLCIRGRGVRKDGVITTTSFMSGAFREKPGARSELLFLLGGA